jgi:signal transduction histidine kinase
VGRRTPVPGFPGRRAAGARCYRRGMANRRQLVDGVAIVLAIVALAVGVLVPVLARMDPGVRLSVDETAGRIYVESVEPLSPAGDHGIQAGMIVTTVNDVQLVVLPSAVYPEPPPDVTPDPMTGEVPYPSPILDPPQPVALVSGTDQLRAIAAQPVRTLEVVSPSELEAAERTGEFSTNWFYDDGRNSLLASLMVVVFGIAVLFGVAWWLLSGRTGLGLQDLALPLALAAASPFLLDPLRHLWHPMALATLAVLLPATMLPLAFALVDRIEGEPDRRLVLAGIAVCAVGAIVTGLARDLWAGYSDLGYATGLLTAGITVIPGFIAAGPALADPGAGDAPGAESWASGRVLRSAELAIAGFTPAAALITAPSGAPWLFLGWGVAIAAAGRFTVRPLARLASRAQLQRDLVVAATEAERARVAADIHDDALQELTLLVRRLDAAGDAEGAEIARTVSDRLRAICGDLRLPILDDLGVGPALDWLVLRIERLAGGEVRLERSDGTRPPPDVELAFFRIAQEALSNAVKHGRPPIVVRYRSTEAAASLSIDDAGAGIPADASTHAEREGRFGLLNMQQRAEAIGAILDIRRWPSGGTHVQLEWRAR